MDFVKSQTDKLAKLSEKLQTLTGKGQDESEVLLTGKLLALQNELEELRAKRRDLPVPSQPHLLHNPAPLGARIPENVCVEGEPFRAEPQRSRARSESPNRARSMASRRKLFGA
jgi:hypothetical protein